tara:strand:+ start:692 stop:1171 length:480 start_codon:yes stop_codon:yes gene_type:complete
MPRKSKKSKVKFHSDSNALHVRKINGIPVLRSHIKMNFSPDRLHVSSCKNGNFKSQNFKNPREFIANLQNNNMSIHETLAPFGKNKKTNFYHKSKPIFQGLPPIIRIHKPTRKLTPYPEKPTKKPPTKKVVPKKPPTKTDKRKILKKLAQSLKQLEKTI